MSDTKSKFQDTIISLISGATAGTVSRTLTAPMDRIKTVMQIGRGVPLRPPGLTKSQFKSLNHPDGTWNAAVAIFRESGWKGFWRGNGVNVLKVIPDEALKFALKRHVTLLFAGDPDHATLKQHVLAGAVSGGVTQSIIYPLEVIKTRMTVASYGEWKSIGQCVNYTRKQGWNTFYRGFCPNLAGIIPFQGTYFGIFFHLIGLYEKDHKGQKASLTTQLNYSILASSLAVLVSYPFNLVRTKLQTQGVNGRAVLYTGMVNCFEQTVKYEGLKGLYRGLVANYWKALPSLSISLLLVKGINDYLHSFTKGRKYG